MAGNANSGRLKSLETVAKECGIAFQKNATALHQCLIDKALQGDKDCLMYLFDRHFGKPKSNLDINSRTQISFSADYLALASMRDKASTVIEVSEPKQLAAGDNGTLGLEDDSQPQTSSQNEA